MRSENTKRIIKEIAREHNISEKQLYDIVKAPFDFLKEVMSNADREALEFPSVRIKYLGTFYCSESRKNYFRMIQRKKREGFYDNFKKRRRIEPLLPRGSRPDNEGDMSRGDETGGVQSPQGIQQQDAQAVPQR